MWRLTNIVTKALYIISKYKYTILTILYFCTIVIYPIGMRPRLTLVMGAISLLFVLNIIAKTKYVLILKILLAILIAVNAFFAFVYKSYISIGTLGSMIETNSIEASSMIKLYCMPAIIILIVTLLLILLSTKELRSSNISRRVSCLVLVVYIFVMSPLCFRRVVITDLHESYNDAPLVVMQVVANHYSPLVYGNMVTILAYANEMYTFAQYANSDRVMPQGIDYIDNQQASKKIFLIIGESSSRSHYSLYGYDVPTTPFLDSLHHNIYSTQLEHYNALASSSFTRNAVPIMLSTATAHDPHLFYKEKTLLDLAKMANYEIVWISNQPRTDLLSVVQNYVGNLTGQADHAYFFTEGTMHLDYDLVPVIEQYIKDDNTYQLFVIHLAGSHQSYAEKYNEEDKKALPAADSIINEVDADMNHVLHYDRSIHHTDRVLQGIYNIAKRNSSWTMYYSPDHGEEVGMGHGLSSLAREQFEIPLIIINNIGANKNSIIGKYMTPSDSLVNNGNTMYIVAEIMGYKVDKTVVEKAMDNGQYVIHGDGKVHKFEDIDK